MGTRIAAALPRIVLALAVCLLASATIGFAAEVRVKPQRHHAVAAKRHVLVVPDVRRQVFVFAKGMLEDGGFGWRVEGSVRGFAPNRVISQSPAPGTRVIDTGSPKITLTLERDTSYAQQGSPEDRSPYTATKIKRVLRATAKAHKPRKARVVVPVSGRPPAFAVSGAPNEPAGAPALPDRARRLAVWVNRHRAPTSAHVRHWLSEHAWIVTGARFGWSGGAEALSVLVRVDRRAEHFWGVGARNRRVANHALRFVRAKSG